MNIYQYLININEGKPFNAQRLRKLLYEESLSLEQLGEPRHFSSDKYFLDNINQSLLDIWLKKFSPATSRMDASLRRGDSHVYLTKTAYFVGKLNILNADDFVIKCDGEFILKALKVSNDAILIENSECYTYSEKFLSAVGLSNLSSNTIIIWSAGNAISHPAAVDMLSNFNKVYYCSDYDLGGIQIYETLYSHLREKVMFVMPENLYDYAKYCKRPKRLELFNKALSKAKEHGFEPMVNLLVEGKGILEQEVLIGGLDE